MREISNIFSVKVSNEAIDDLNHVNNIYYLNWIQKASEIHWNKLSNISINSKYVWVVVRHEIDYLSSAILNDELNVKTWIGDSYGVKSERFVEIKKGDKLLVKAKTIWCLLDKNTMKPIRIPSEVLSILQTD
ncbi:thioesterase family protein [Lutibacter sp. B1]|uniref:acyl-CoA thioesterase n=1 Tax=Lutibacter sp. B1 TaxID=2725996 RepID=UPI0014575513|nr:thioesterase family protein [Lutibacter sp. B1]NLP59055.1 acyl-CoA thioesterase [Lutibacter sp. B1]